MATRNTTVFIILSLLTILIAGIIIMIGIHLLSNKGISTSHGANRNTPPANGSIVPQISGGNNPGSTGLPPFIEQRRDLVRISEDCQILGLAFSEELKTLQSRGVAQLRGEKEVCKQFLNVLGTLKNKADEWRQESENKGRNLTDQELRQLEPLGGVFSYFVTYFHVFCSLDSKYPEATSKYLKMLFQKARGGMLAHYSSF